MWLLFEYIILESQKNVTEDNYNLIYDSSLLDLEEKKTVIFETQLYHPIKLSFKYTCNQQYNS